MQLEVNDAIGGKLPTPLSGTTWGLPGALSVIVTAPLRVPEAVGVNLTLIVQSAPGATVLLQLFV